MTEISDEKAFETANHDSHSRVFMAGRILARITTTAVGILLASIMAVASLYEFLANDFFGVSLSLLVVIFGIQLITIGISGSVGKKKEFAAPDPLGNLWHSDSRIYPFRPYSYLDIRGR